MADRACHFLLPPVYKVVQWHSLQFLGGFWVLSMLRITPNKKIYIFRMGYSRPGETEIDRVITNQKQKKTPDKTRPKVAQNSVHEPYTISVNPKP